jgi:hypothetical protein
MTRRCKTARTQESKGSIFNGLVIQETREVVQFV